MFSLIIYDSCCYRMTVRICDADDMYKSIKQCQDIVTKIFGCHVKFILLKNTTGDFTRMVVSSHDLFNFLQPKCDVLKLMICFLKNHVAVTMDGGLFTFLMSSNLVLKSHSLPYFELSNDKKYLLSEIRQFLNTINIFIDISKFSDVQSIIKTILMPKITLSWMELDCICILYTTSFASTMKKEDIKVVRVISKIKDSCIYDGFLLPVESYFDDALLPTKLTLRVCLVNVSLSIDSEELLGEKKESIIVSSRMKTKEEILNFLCKFCYNFSKQADVLICQKVVHPKVKYLLKQNNVICVDRIGSIALSSLQSLFNCKVMSTLTLTDFAQYISVMNDFKFLNLNNRHFIQITSTSSTSKTLLLCAESDEELDTLAQCFEVSMVLLQGLAVHPQVVYGGGCIETMIAMHLLYLRTKKLKISCTNNLRKVVDVVVKSFLSVALAIDNEQEILEHFIDDSFHHHWINPKFRTRCCCGSINSNIDLNFIPFIELISSGNIHEKIIEAKTINLVSYADIVIHPSEVFLRNLEASVTLSDIVSHISFQILQI
ncbi:molecular chaperone MKKS-like [Hydra vulgaris]|uniref:Molecular chaperone MKKS-like n=1 Tax=Hydra vulgaris TaxID=6087 RepID=A0ABM4D6X5_HYDVU